MQNILKIPIYLEVWEVRMCCNSVSCEFGKIGCLQQGCEKGYWLWCQLGKGKHMLGLRV